MKPKLFGYSIIISLFLMLSLSAYADTTTCGDGALSYNSKNYSGVSYNTWNYWNSTNNTRVGAVNSLVTGEGIILNISEKAIIGGENQTSVLIYNLSEIYGFFWTLNNYSVQVWNGSYGNATSEMQQNGNWTAYNTTLTTWFIIWQRNMSESVFNVSYTVNVSSGLDISFITWVYETNISSTTSNYNIDGNWSNKYAWRINDTGFSGGSGNWTFSWSEYPRVCTTTAATSITSCKSTRDVIWAGFGVIAIAMIVLAAFLLINFQGTSPAMILTTVIGTIALSIVLMVGWYIIAQISGITCIPAVLST